MVEGLKYWSNVVNSFDFRKSSSSCIFYKLKLFDGLLRKACEKTYAVVNPPGNKGMNEFFLNHVIT